MRRPGNDALWIGLLVAAAVAGAVIIARSLRVGEDQSTFDDVDEASDESFPASDAPSQTPVVGASASGPRRR